MIAGSSFLWQWGISYSFLVASNANACAAPWSFVQEQCSLGHILLSRLRCQSAFSMVLSQQYIQSWNLLHTYHNMYICVHTRIIRFTRGNKSNIRFITCRHRTKYFYEIESSPQIGTRRNGTHFVSNSLSYIFWLFGFGWERFVALAMRQWVNLMAR